MAQLDRITQQPTSWEARLASAACGQRSAWWFARSALGAPRNARSRSPAHETAGGHEPFAALGWPVSRCWRRCGALVLGWRGQRAGRGDHGLALANDFVVLTHDLDFSAILAATQRKKLSIVQVRADDVSPNAIGGQVLIALRQLEAELHKGALVTIDSSRTRMRVLPLRA